MKHNLTTTGLSLSQASSISNLCYQRAHEITNALSGINNATRTFVLNGDTFTQVVGKPVPTDVAKLIQEKAKLHAAQSFLMTNIKAKDSLLSAIRTKRYEPSKAVLDLVPQEPTLDVFKPIKLVDELWGWDQLSPAESAEYLEQEAYAAHIGQFIHKDSILDKLRNELPKIQTLDWIDVKVGEKTPVKVAAHHTPGELLKHHEELANLHRTHEQRVNYFKAKVKNLVSNENARISKENAVEQAKVNKLNEEVRLAYTNKRLTFIEATKVEGEEFEASRQAEMQSTAALRISVDPRFQETIDIFLKKLDPES